jgi:hypothetical protein
MADEPQFDSWTIDDLRRLRDEATRCQCPDHRHEVPDDE